MILKFSVPAFKISAVVLSNADTSVTTTDPPHQSHNALGTCPTMENFCNRNVHSCAHFGYKNDALWDLWIMSTPPSHIHFFLFIVSVPARPWFTTSMWWCLKPIIHSTVFYLLSLYLPGPVLLHRCDDVSSRLSIVQFSIYCLGSCQALHYYIDVMVSQADYPMSVQFSIYCLGSCQALYYYIDVMMSQADYPMSVQFSIYCLGSCQALYY